MKTEKNLEKSMRARLNETIRRSESVNMIADNIKMNGFHPDRMQALRDEAEAVLQSVHEYSAYHNALETE